jgi:membrane protein YdbS with pleckstrin-like domain
MAAGPRVQRYLLPSEQRVFAVRRHWIAVAPDVALFLAFLVGGLFGVWLFRNSQVPKTVAVFFIIFSVLWLLWRIGDWYYEEIAVTNRRVLLITGILTRKVAIMPLIKVTDLTFEQTLQGRLLHYGTFIIESAGQDQALSRIDYLAHPLQRYRDVTALLFGTNADQDPEDVRERQHDTAEIPTVRPRRRQ